MAALDRPVGVGIKAIEIYLPNRYIAQSELEVHDGVSAGKYEIGLGQIKMGYCDDREDIYSFCLTAVSQLLEKYEISPSSIGRLEVGTETLLDKSKSVKSVLMQLFAPSGNTDIEGVDTINACYGGTNALFNAINWVQSDSWDGRDAIVVTGDIAIYDRGPARPTGGAGAVAMLIGPNAPLVIEPGRRGSYMQHTYDFYKPNMSSEYPVVDGQYSIECYFRALDACYKAYTARSKTVEDRKAAVTNGSTLNGHKLNGVHQNGNANGSSKEDIQSQSNGHTNGQTNGHANGYTNGNTNGYTNGTTNGRANGHTNGHANGHNNGNTNNETEETTLSDTTEFENFDYMCFHTPNTKLAQKSYARLQYNDYILNPLDPKYKTIPASIRDITPEKSLSDKSIEKAFMTHTSDLYKKRSLPSALAASMCGNMYTASVYGALASLICNVSSDELAGKRIAMFSYGSGLASSMFSLTVVGDVGKMRGVLDINARLKARIHKSPTEYEKALYLREVAYSRAGLTPYGDVDELVKGTYYLEYVDEKFRRFYKIKE